MPESANAILKSFRACDQCHRRKVKCERAESHNHICKNCKGSGLECTYNSVPQKKGPKGSRAKVISEIREHQKRTSFSTRFRPNLDVLTNSSPSSPVAFGREIPIGLIDSCVDFFFQNVYPTQPILNRAQVAQHVARMSHAVESYCLVAVLCAYMLIQPGMQVPSNLQEADSDMASPAMLGSTILSDVIEARKSSAYIEFPTVTTVQISFFLFGCYFNLENHSVAWFHLRESSTFALLLCMNQEQTYQGEDAVEARLKRHLFWLLFVTERAYALQTQRPLTLHDSIALPEVPQDEEESVKLTGFLHLINLYKPFDDVFVGLWNQSIGSTSAEWISKLQKQLAAALPVYLRSTETQAVDLRTSQQWLRIMVWQLSISHRLLSSSANDEALTFRYPIELSRQLAAEAHGFSQRSMEVHGIGLVKKVFDVACTLVDVMSCVSIPPQSLELGPREFLHQFMRVISRLRGGQERYLPLLLAKVNDTLPNAPGGTIAPNLNSLPSSIDGQFDELRHALQIPHDDTSDSTYHGSSMGPPSLGTEYSDLVPNSPYIGNQTTTSPFDEGAMDVPFSLSHSNSYSHSQ